MRPLFTFLATLGLMISLSASVFAENTDIGGPFELSTVNGERFGSEELKGKPYALFFGFTNCPEVCPTALAEITLSLSALGEDGNRLTPIFVTVDPVRDTAEQLKEYLGSFDNRIVGLRGSEDEIAEVARRFKATYRKVPYSDGDYTIDHTAVIYLMDGNGTFFDKIDYREPHEAQLEKFRRLIAANGANVN